MEFTCLNIFICREQGGSLRLKRELVAYLLSAKARVRNVLVWGMYKKKKNKSLTLCSEFWHKSQIGFWVVVVFLFCFIKNEKKFLPLVKCSEPSVFSHYSEHETSKLKCCERQVADIFTQFLPRWKEMDTTSDLSAKYKFNVARRCLIELSIKALNMGKGGLCSKRTRCTCHLVCLIHASANDSVQISWPTKEISCWSQSYSTSPCP